MLKRRKIGAAFERSPAEKLGEWSGRNLLVLIAAVGGAVGWWLLVDWIVNGLLNFLFKGSQESLEDPFSSEDPMWIGVKLIGAILIAILIGKTQAK